MTAPILDVTGLEKRFAVGVDDVAVLEGVDLQVGRGEFVCVVGASGCGKSTLLNIIAGLEPASGGTVTVGGSPVTGPGADRGMVFQRYTLFPWRTVAENVAFGLDLAGWPKTTARARVAELLDTVGLAPYADALPRTLSGGMQQRTAIARALAPQPELLLLDEPFGALDAQTKRGLQDFLHDLWRRTGTTVVMVTHDIEEAVYLAQRVYVLASLPGRVRAEITVDLPAHRHPGLRRDPRAVRHRDGIEDLLAERPAYPRQDGVGASRG